MTKRAKPEILAPAGSMEGLKAAIAAGCNAVYIGGNRFGARAFANNLDQDEMLEELPELDGILGRSDRILSFA